MPTHTKKQSPKSLFGLIKYTLARAFIYFTGIRIYEQPSNSLKGEILVGQTLITSVMDTKLEFNFYRKKYTDLIYKRGKIRTEVFIGYSIECKFDDSFVSSMHRYNNLKFVLRQTSLDIIPEKDILYLLMEFFVTFMANEMHKTEEGNKVSNF